MLSAQFPANSFCCLNKLSFQQKSVLKFFKMVFNHNYTVVVRKNKIEARRIEGKKNGKQWRVINGGCGTEREENVIRRFFNFFLNTIKKCFDLGA